MSSTTPGQRQSYQQQQQQLGSSEREEGSSNDGGIHVKRESHESDVRGRRVASAGDRGSAAQAPTERGHRRRAELPETIRTFLNRPDEVARDDVRTIINNFEKTQLVELLAHASTLSKEVRDALRAVVGSNATFRRLLVRNISFQSSSDTVKNALGKFGIIEEGTVVYDRHTGRSKGFAFVTFERVESACEAVSCSNQGKIYLDGRQLILKFAADKIDHDQQMGVVQATHSGSERDKSAEISVSTMGGGGRTAVVRASADDTGNKSGTYSNQSMRKLFVYNLAPYTTSVTLRVRCCHNQ
ncbi:RNA binding motif protein, putative [Perkinsus marinus ATCC 50983]|uniref:RNA binding motif protein, putative n=1 Tax=Perkinsus marinus (strain ATCC 50983 / TXsc) TaxID=423536 RepID=C5KJB1_PERM5|nr:RNA binding motif protein, putative [Perkinsus marinus ATCC 50983]EER15413.1 RNA binding motif protein, putative [Perkinsus marinus ATCC 50983]|eukprot:XP_002783617.1 RNA binding motif protein, putative [Perkinsus marinus ATCC 50983]